MSNRLFKIASTFSNTQKRQKYYIEVKLIDPLSASPTKWLSTLKKFVGNFPTNCLSVCD